MSPPIIVSFIESRNLQSPGTCRGFALQDAGGRVIEGSLRLLLEGAPLGQLISLKETS